jgi:hypothetical protein
MSNSKKCVVCGETKEVNSTNFFRSKFHDADGYSSTCAACNVKQSHAREAALSAESPNYNPMSKRQDGLKKRSKEYYRKLAIDMLLSRGMKKCGHCEEIKPVSEYTPSKMSYTGLSSWCKECDKEHAKQRWAAYKEQAGE